MASDPDKAIRRAQRNPGRKRFVVWKGELVEIRAGIGRVDDRPRRSMALGCPDPKEQRKRLRMYESAGISGCEFDPDTAELCFPAGFNNQRKLAQLHGLDVA